MILLTVKWNGEDHVLSNLSSRASKCIGAVFSFFPIKLIKLINQKFNTYQ